jgi:hypothetical protein
LQAFDDGGHLNGKLYIPKRVNVGLVNRNDTYTGQLGYLVYWDDKGVLRKEKSWQGWRDKSIEPVAFDNLPSSGFILNRPVGGHRTQFGYRGEKVRVYDPRGFEFEITMDNLLHILAHHGSTPGKGLDGQLVYAWDRDSLVLLSTDSQEYRESLDFTELQAKSVGSLKDLVPGMMYRHKDQSVLTYLGRLTWHILTDDSGKMGKRNLHTFWGDDQRQPWYSPETSKPWYAPVSKVDHLACEIGPDPKFAEKLDRFLRGSHGSSTIGFKIVDGLHDGQGRSEIRHWAEEGGYFVQKSHLVKHRDNNDDQLTLARMVRIHNGVIDYRDMKSHYYDRDNAAKYKRKRVIKPDEPHWDRSNASIPWVEPRINALVRVMESGAEVPFRYLSDLEKRKKTYVEDVE